MIVPACKTCDGVRMLIRQVSDTTSTIGIGFRAYPCPECRPHLRAALCPPKPTVVRDGKMAAAGKD